MKAPAGYGYHAGLTEKVPKEMAEKFVEQGYARATKPSLPADIPERKALLEAGIETIESVIEKHQEDAFESVKGVGEQKARQLETWLIEQGYISLADPANPETEAK